MYVYEAYDQDSQLVQALATSRCSCAQPAPESHQIRPLTLQVVQDTLSGV
jgi:hypothetical protein